MSEQKSNANDYALATYLNERVVSMFALVADNFNKDLPDLTDINRSYVLLVTELKKLYDRNPELSNIRENICWRTFGTLDAIDSYDLYEYTDDYKNHGIQHISKVNALAINVHKEKPDITPELQKILDEAKINVTAFANNWFIPVYTFEITEAGILLVNGTKGVMSVNKVQAGSPTEIALTQAKEKPNEIFLPNLGKITKLARGLTTSLKDLGFKNETLRRLFFPVMDDKRGIKFRPVVTRKQAEKENIDLTKLDEKLKQLGAETVFDTYNLES